ncbi:pyridoxamine 5'-phosphate oxidase family protein [Cohnella cholangitidis]|uniref:Pyridoxamine 5'-phosphate oxidase family protein n=1 Tax=Cohnella cholangitidis TaxID=2598458 RepID=A0A7G5BYC7_9BACL|nr:pyridoxamine 5'-phosphate oxidase family protein [Cohnella cholangitidis]QMV41961.1 pyridoxamine 5'-phosphate oxidase family protein [Cohnella cholangitidis]
MNPLRMYKRECTDPYKINGFLEQARTGFLGLSSEDAPYVIPLNYVWRNGTIYFHGASEGRKITMLQSNSRACFTVCEDQGTITDVVPANTDTAFMSVMLFGTVALVAELEEATAAMQSMLDKYVPGYYDHPLAKSHVEKYVSSLGSKTAVYKLVPAEITAKESGAQEGRMFYAGKTQRDEPSHA